MVPNADSPVRRRFGDDWHGWDPPFHVCLYNPATLTGVAERAGLRLHRHRVLQTAVDYARSKALATGRAGRRLALRAAVQPPMKFLQWFGYGGVLVADMRPATP